MTDFQVPMTPKGIFKRIVCLLVFGRQMDDLLYKWIRDASWAMPHMQSVVRTHIQQVADILGLEVVDEP